MYRDPTPNDLVKKEFNAIWNVLKTWDINVPGDYEGYCGATGNHVMAILDSLHDLVVPSYDVSLLLHCECGKDINVNKPIIGPVKCICGLYVIQTCSESDRYCDGGG